MGNRRHTGRAEQRLSAVTNVATRRASSVESARRTASIGFLDSTGIMLTVKLAFLKRAGTRDRGLSSSQAAIVTASQMRKERPRSSR